MLTLATSSRDFLRGEGLPAYSTIVPAAYLAARFRLSETPDELR